jgi:cytochrome c-type biogenesis protein
VTPELVLAASSTSTVTSGSLLLALPVAFAAGVVSFLSPCVLPLVPGYLSYITGVTGADMVDRQAEEEAGEGAGTKTIVQKLSKRSWLLGRVTIGTLLFILGFSIVFVSAGVLFGALGQFFLTWSDTIQRVLGVVVIIMGLAYMGWLPGLQRDYKVHKRVPTGLWGAPLLGILFGLGWTPCIGPTLTAVLSLATSEASALRGAILSFAYALGLGLPFLIMGLLLERALNAVRFLRKHQLLIVRIGGGLLIVIGILLVFGLWGDLNIWLRTQVGSGSSFL